MVIDTPRLTFASTTAIASIVGEVVVKLCRNAGDPVAAATVNSFATTASSASASAFLLLSAHEPADTPATGYWQALIALFRTVNNCGRRVTCCGLIGVHGVRPGRVSASAWLPSGAARHLCRGNRQWYVACRPETLRIVEH